MYGAVPKEEMPRRKRSAANIAVLRLGIVTIIASNFTSSAIFPFFPIIVREKAGNPIIVGMIFSSLPFAKAVMAPFVPIISQKVGRVSLLCFGLIAAAVSLTSFGLVDDFRFWFFLRAFQGASNALIDGPSMALLLAHSNDVAEDLGLMESAAGLSYVVGPAVGGAIYTYFGFQNAFLFLASGYIVSLALVPFVVMGASSHINKNASKVNVVKATNKKNADNNVGALSEKQSILAGKGGELNPIKMKSEGKEEYEEEEGGEIDVKVSPWDILGNEPAVWIASAASVLVWSTVCFYDVYLSGQLRQTLGIGARGRGVIYVWPALTYAVFSLFLGTICRKIGARNVLLCGSLGHIVVLMAYGPNVYITEIADHFGYLEFHHGRGFEWYCIIVAMGLWGFCLAPLFQSTLPLMHAALAAKGHLKIPSRLNNIKTEAEEGGEGEYEPTMAERRAAIIKEKIEDALSALQQTTGASGAILGPVLGGLALEYLPKRKDPGCDPKELLKELDDDSTSTIINCSTGFAWATTIIAGLFLIVSCLILTLPNYKSVDEFEGEVVTMEVLTASPLMRRRNSHASTSNHGSDSSHAATTRDV
jgi:MFS family permease